MAFLYVTEYAELAQADPGAVAQAGQEPSITVQKIAIGGSSTASSAFNASTKFVELHADAICSYVVGTATPTAAITNTRMAANQTKMIGVGHNKGHMVAVITNT